MAGLWETLEEGPYTSTRRMRTPNGWVLRFSWHIGPNPTPSMVHVPDVAGKWDPADGTWVSIDEEPDREMWGIVTDGQHAVVAWFDIEGEGGWGWEGDHFEGHLTHWRPLPSLPNQD